MKTTLLITILTVAFVLSACGSAPQQPTPDVAFVQTSAANTVVANFTLTAKAAVTNTPLAAITAAATALETQTQSPAASPAIDTPTLLPGGVTATPGLCDHYTWN